MAGLGLCNSVVFVALLVIGSCFGGTPFLKFRQVESTTHRNGSFSYFGMNKPIIVDGLFPRVTIQIVELLNNIPPRLEFHCVVDKLSRDSPITTAQLCFETPSSSKLSCDDALGSSYLLPEKYKFKSSGDVYTGYVFTSNWVRDNFPLDATYFCRLGNSNGVIQSNMIEVQDLDSYVAAFSKRKPLDPVLLDPIVGSHFPLSLECGNPIYPVDLPAWAKQTFRVPYDWVVCEADVDSQLELRKCYDRSEPIVSYFDHTVLPNGTLIIHELAKDWRPIGILCISSFIRNMVFSAYFQNNDGKPAPFTFITGSYPNQIIPHSPQYDRVTLRSGWHARDAITLNALYTANPKIVTAKWTKDEGPLPLQITGSRHSLTFPQDIKPSYAGTYVLSLKTPYETLRFKYEVLVEQPPVIKQDPPRDVFVLQGHQAQLTAEFDGHITSRSVFINGIPIDTLSASNYRESLRLLRDSFPYIGELNPEIEFPSESSIRYTVRDLAFTPNSPYGASHTVTMVAANSLGSVRTNTLIRVLPVPEVLHQLSEYSCVEDCFNHTTHRFYCDIELAPYSGLRVVKTWELDGQDLERLDPRDNRLTFLNHSSREVVLNIVQGDSDFDELFANVDLSCRFRVFGPETELFAGHMYETPLYDTKSDPNLHGMLTAHIRKYPSSLKIVNVASISWIVAVVIAVLILLIVAVLAVCIVMRNKGKTYMLEREELVRGNDPEKEFRDRAAFQDYERCDEPPVLGCNQSLEDAFQEVGSEDEGELEFYGTDPVGRTNTAIGRLSLVFPITTCLRHFRNVHHLWKDRSI
uniref:Bravo_FIGEY domain-containing protein n=1 Tax=Mesocestoides corti TaxID=53468 RepID=A0A5K3EN41_MESCO